jgi:hypothetical protein
MRNPFRVGGNCLLALVTLCCAAGCGDNSKECGPGTVDDNGACVPSAECGAGTVHDQVTDECVPDGSLVCSEGTVFDALTGRCKIDPASCRDGTVLINNACVDPTAGLTIDVQEGPEPNGLGIIEASTAQAGNITLKATNSAFVIHGTIDPWRDSDADSMLDPDIDTYVLSVPNPTLLDITADGVHGITAGFVAVAEVGATDPLASWQRFGIRLAGDASQRQVFLPKAGTYRIAIGDTRTLGEYLTSTVVTAAPGGNNGDYYVSITDVGAPMITMLTGSSTSGVVDGNALRFFRSAAGTGITQATVAMPSDLVQASVVVMVNGALRGVADETSQPARVMTGTLAAGDETFVVVDHVFDISPSPTMYTLSVNTTNL